MDKKYLFSLVPLFVFVMLLLTSVASAQFIRKTGPEGSGNGYGFGFGEGYGWDVGNEYIGGMRTSSDLPNDVWGYGYGTGILSNDPTFYNPVTGIYSQDLLNGNPEDALALLLTGVVGVDGLSSEGGPVAFTGFTFYAPVRFSIGDKATVDIATSTVFSLGSAKPIVFLIGTTTVGVSDLPANYSAITDGAIEFGLPELGVNVSPAITININVGATYNGTTLKVLSKTSGGVWELLTTCAVSGGICSLQTTHLSSFVTANYTDPNANTTSSGGGGSIVPINPRTFELLTPEVVRKIAIKNNCYKLEKDKLISLSSSFCFSKKYNRATKKYVSTLKPGIETYTGLVRVGKASTFYLINGQCQKALVLKNWRTIVSAKKVTSITAKKLATYPACPTL